MQYSHSVFMNVKQLCEIRMGHSFRCKLESQPEGPILVIQPKDIPSAGSLSPTGLCRVNLGSVKRLNKGDVLLINRGRFTACTFDGTINEPCIATSAFLVFTPKDPSQLLPEYLALFFNSAEGQNRFKRLTMTTTIPFISLGNLESIEIPVPPLDVQRKLVDLEHARKRFAHLAARKVELLDNLINMQIATNN